MYMDAVEKDLKIPPKNSNCKWNSVCLEMDEHTSSKPCSSAIHVETSVGVSLAASWYSDRDGILKLQLKPTDTETVSLKHSCTC
jgi:hypothetical protein